MLSRCSMFFLVTLVAKCLSVTHFKPEIREVPPRLDVVRLQIPATRIAASLTGESISREDIEPPIEVRGRTSVLSAIRISLCALAIFVIVVGRATPCTGPQLLTQRLTLLDCPSLTAPLKIWLAQLNGADSLSKLRREVLSFHRRNKPARSAYRGSPGTTCSATTEKTVSSRLVGRCFQYRQFPGELSSPVEVQPDNPKYHRNLYPHWRPSTNALPAAPPEAFTVLS